MAIESSTVTQHCLSLGPLLYNWPQDQARDFYFQVADEMDLDRVYLGEVVCSKRTPFHSQYWPEVIERLQNAGKQVILSSLSLLTLEREIKAAKENIDLMNNMVEVNDITMLGLIKQHPFTIGPFINTYNENTLSFFERLGASLITLPFELPRKTISILAQVAQCPLEIHVFGRIPLAMSARCYHARANGLHKDNCQFICEQSPDGLLVQTIQNQEFLAVNGTQVQSSTYCNLIQEIPDLQDMGINHFRISPQTLEMAKIVQVFRAVQRKKQHPESGLSELKRLVPDHQFSNGFYYQAFGKHFQHQ